MAKTFILEVHTPYRLFYCEAILGLTVTITDGEIGVFFGHSYFTSPVREGILKIKTLDGKWLEAFIREGFLEVKDVKSVLLVDAAEWPNEIDYKRALQAKEAAEEKLKNRAFKFEDIAAKEALDRAEHRLKVYIRQYGTNSEIDAHYQSRQNN